MISKTESYHLPENWLNMNMLKTIKSKMPNSVKMRERNSWTKLKPSDLERNWLMKATLHWSWNHLRTRHVLSEDKSKDKRLIDKLPQKRLLPRELPPPLLNWLTNRE